MVLDVYPAVPSAQAMRPQTPNPTKTILLTLARVPYARALALPLLKELAYQENSARKHGFVQHSPPLQPESIVAGPEQARELRSKMLCSQLFKSNPKRPKEKRKDARKLRKASLRSQLCSQLCSQLGSQRAVILDHKPLDFYRRYHGRQPASFP